MTVYNTKLVTLCQQMRSLLGDNLGYYLLSSELRNLNYTFDDFNDDDYDLLISNLTMDFVPLLGEKTTRWLLEELKRPGFGS